MERDVVKGKINRAVKRLLIESSGDLLAAEANSYRTFLALWD